MWLVRKNTPATPLSPGLAQLMKLTTFTFTCLLNLTCDLRAEIASSSAVYISGGISKHKKICSQFLNL